jgi:hypothetical protein
MSDPGKIDTRSIERRALLAGSAVFALTSIHHVYGGIHYGTPWRIHAAAVAALAAIAMLFTLRISRAKAGSRTGRAAWWAFWSIGTVVFVLLFGVFEGAYNHVLKDLLFLAGTSLAHMRQLFPPPMYEMPNDWFFEVTGVLQVIPAALTANYLARLLGGRRQPRGTSGKSRVGVDGGFDGGFDAGVAKRGTSVPRLATIAQRTIRVTGPLLVALGLLFWTGRALPLLPFHMSIGLLFVLALILLGAVAARVGVRRAQVALIVALALLIPIVGVIQARLLPGSWHWLVKLFHLLIGIAGMIVAARVGRSIRDRAPAPGSVGPRPVAEPSLAARGEASRPGLSTPSFGRTRPSRPR